VFCKRLNTTGFSCLLVKLFSCRLLRIATYLNEGVVIQKTAIGVVIKAVSVSIRQTVVKIPLATAVVVIIVIVVKAVGSDHYTYAQQQSRRSTQLAFLVQHGVKEQKIK